MLIASIVATVISACLVHGTRTVSFYCNINPNHLEPEPEPELELELNHQNTRTVGFESL